MGLLLTDTKKDYKLLGCLILLRSPKHTHFGCVSGAKSKLNSTFSFLGTVSQYKLNFAMGTPIPGGS